MADGSGNTAIAIFVILVIAVGAYFLFFANPGGGDGGTINIIVPTLAP